MAKIQNQNIKIKFDKDISNLTKKQKRVLDFIESTYLATGNSPTYEEIAKKFGWKSVNSVTNHVKALRKKRLIEESEGRNRHVVPNRISRSYLEHQNNVPLIGNIAAGIPIEAIENVETWFNLDAFGISNKNNDKFALRVKGNSMINRGIRDKDIVIVKRQPFVTSNDVAAVRIGNEVTLKYVKQEKDHVILVPDNDFMPPIKVESTDDFEVIGKVIMLFRENI